jgi:mannose-6-phosphate isomerase
MLERSVEAAPIMRHCAVPSALYSLKNPLQKYAWGSRTALAGLRGDPAPSADPEAELWMGAHASAPSLAVTPQGERPLPDLFAGDPERLLGERSIAAFGARLPFLLKLLAADTPLSLQAHPSIDRARRGYALEEAAGIARNAPQRNYKDTNHKPELICALTPFSALVGFRALSQTRELFGQIAAEPLRPLMDALHREPESAALRAFCELALGAPAPERKRFADAALSQCQALCTVPGPFRAELEWGARIGALYPGDSGIAIALALNLLVLSPGEAIYLPAGNLHAYLEGFGVEIMASSDNVLRGGLTPKHVDVPELLEVLEFVTGPATLVATERRGSEVVYKAPAPEFLLSRIDGAAGALDAVSGPEILVVTRGAVEVVRGDERARLRAGEAVLVPAAGGPYALEGADFEVFRARVNLTARQPYPFDPAAAPL